MIKKISDCLYVIYDFLSKICSAFSVNPFQKHSKMNPVIKIHRLRKLAGHIIYLFHFDIKNTVFMVATKISEFLVTLLCAFAGR